VDLSGSYDFRNGLTIRGGGRNILDEEFPFSLNRSAFPFDGKRVDLRGRVLFLEASYNFDI
jgi:outer membrane receptor protein involved in Fe transport